MTCRNDNEMIGSFITRACAAASSRFAIAIASAVLVASPLRAQDHHHHHVDTPQVSETGDLLWRMPMDVPMEPMFGGMEALVPQVTPFLPGMGIDPESLPFARPAEVLPLADGDTLELIAGLVRREINGKVYVMYAFNEQFPGPLIQVDQGSTVHIRFRNQTELPSAIHWHGIRLDNPFDGVPGVTQAPVETGEDFLYDVFFWDAGIYWYHPHLREDVGQEMGLYGNIDVKPADDGYWSVVNREEFITLDDILIDRGDLVPFGLEHANYSLMGRFGNTYLTNGVTDYELHVPRGEVVRYHFTNVSNARTYNLSFGDEPRMKAVGSDVGRYEREEWVESMVIAPAERYTVEVRHDKPGRWPIYNKVQAVDLFRGQFYSVVDTLGTVVVSEDPATPDYGSSFERLRVNEDVIAEFDAIRHHFDRPVDHELELTVRAGTLPLSVMQMIAADTAYFPPVEWHDLMPMMNWIITSQEMEWILRDRSDRKENGDIRWAFKLGDIVKIRIVNDPSSFHPMNHPIHFHGQRFLVLERDGIRNPNLVWKDTALIPTGSTVDILLELSNPGTWMAHCHIAEHLESGMAFLFTVDEEERRIPVDDDEL